MARRQTETETEPAEAERRVNRPTDGPWFLQENDEAQGWCICNVDRPPSRHDPERGDRVVAVFVRRADAELIIALRNAIWTDLGGQTDERFGSSEATADPGGQRKGVGESSG